MEQHDFSSIEDAYRNSSRRAPAPQPSRRMFGIDFMFVIVFLVAGFYFVWPKLFQTPEPYAPESAIHEVLTVYLQAQSCCVVSEDSGEDADVAGKIKQALEAIQPKGSKAPKILLLNDSGNILVGEENWPEIWEKDNPPWQYRKPGSMIYRFKGKAILIFFEPITDTELTLVVIKSFKPMFDGDGKNSDLVILGGLRFAFSPPYA